MDHDDREPFFHISSSSSSPALDTHTDHTITKKKKQQQGFDFSAPDVLSGYDFQASTPPRRRTFSVEHASSRRHASSGSPVYLTGELFSAREDAKMDSHNSKIVSAVERTIKKYADNILRVLEGMNGRLSQLESVTQVLEHSVASLKASVDDYHGEVDARSKALNNHVVEMHRSVQILRDKQDIVERNAELAKLHASKVEAVGEKASAVVLATKQPVASSQIVTQEQLNLAVVSNLVPKRSFTQPQVSSQQSNEISGQLQQLSLLADVNTLPQQLVPAQVHILQQSHVWSQSETRPTLQPQEMIQSMPGVFQAQSQHAQTPQIVQHQQGLLPAQPQQVQVQQSVESQKGVFQTQQQHAQTQQNVRSQQGEFQTQPQHVQTQHSVQLQQGMFQAQQQHVHIQQSALSQEGTFQGHQQRVQAQQTVPFQQGAFQTQTHHVQPQQGTQAPQGVFQAQPQHLQIQQSAQSQQGSFQAQQQHVQTQQNVQSQQGAIQAQPQHVQTQQNIQQGPQAQAFRGPVQQLQPPPSQIPNQTAIISSQSEQVQFQVAPQHLIIQQPLSQQPAMGQPSVQVPHTQYGSMIQALPAQSITQLRQVQPASNSQSQTPQNTSQSTVGQVIVQPPRTPNAHFSVQGVPPGQGTFQFTQLSHAPLPQATVMQAPSSSQVEYGAGPPYNVSNRESSQQHSFYSQPILRAQDSNTYQFPNPLQGAQPVYPSEGARPVTPSAVSSTRALPVAQNVYNQSGPPNHLSRDDGIVDKVAVMGFSRDEARSAVRTLTDQGQIVDMNAVLNLLMNGRNQSQRGWQA